MTVHGQVHRIEVGGQDITHLIKHVQVGGGPCNLCSHPLATHGYGCTSGWFQDGPECYCPNNDGGQIAASCCLVECYAHPVTHVDQHGQFYCAAHAAEEPTWRRDRIRAIADVTKWEAS